MNFTPGPAAQKSRALFGLESRWSSWQMLDIKNLIRELHQAAELLLPVSDVEGYKK